MARARRLHAPGCIVHLTARTHGRQPWLTESLRTRIANEIMLASESSGHRVLAYAIMPNHFHVIVYQGASPLDHLMHRVMHRSAAWIHWTHKLRGHIFQSRYWSGACLDAEYARTAIVYVHLNPCRAGLCGDPAEYEWSTHTHYISEAQSSDYARACARAGLSLFASDHATDTRAQQYLAHVQYQMSIDRFNGGQIAANCVIAPAKCLAGDAHWMAEHSVAAQSFQRPVATTSLYDVACHLLQQLDPHCPMDVVRSGTRTHRVATIRKQLIAALVTRGFRGVALARFFGVSDTAVSRIAVSLKA